MYLNIMKMLLRTITFRHKWKDCVCPFCEWGLKFHELREDITFHRGQVITNSLWQFCSVKLSHFVMYAISCGRFCNFSTRRNSTRQRSYYSNILANRCLIAFSFAICVRFNMNKWFLWELVHISWVISAFVIMWCELSFS